MGWRGWVIHTQLDRLWWTRKKIGTEEKFSARIKLFELTQSVQSAVGRAG